MLFMLFGFCPWENIEKTIWKQDTIEKPHGTIGTNETIEIHLKTIGKLRLRWEYPWKAEENHRKKIDECLQILVLGLVRHCENQP